MAAAAATAAACEAPLATPATPADTNTGKPSGPRWEGAIGPVLRAAPDYPGSADRSVRVSAGYFLRYGRLTVTNTGGFVTRSQQELSPGLAAELLRTDHWHANLGLRWDNGRKASTSATLQNLGDIQATLRARMGVGYKVDEHWRLGAAWSVDMLNHGGGMLFETSLGREHHLTPNITWRYGMGATLADGRYMQSYFGVDAAQAAASGHSAYSPKAGLRDVGLGTGMSFNLGPQWVAFADAGVSRLAGPAATSPLTQAAGSWSVRTGLAWRF